MMSILSQFYFLMGLGVGNLVAWRSCSSWPVGTPVLLFIMYCSAQTSFEIKNWEIRAQLGQQRAKAN